MQPVSMSMTRGTRWAFTPERAREKARLRRWPRRPAVLARRLRGVHRSVHANRRPPTHGSVGRILHPVTVHRGLPLTPRIPLAPSQQDSVTEGERGGVGHSARPSPISVASRDFLVQEVFAVADLADAEELEQDADVLLDRASRCLQASGREVVAAPSVERPFVALRAALAVGS